jgi:DNA-binding CsgD family transcriptional regulator
MTDTSVRSREPSWPSARPSTSRDVLDSFRLPMLLLDRYRKVLHANPPAVRLLAERDPIEAPDGRLRCPRPEDHADLCTALERLFVEAEILEPSERPRGRFVMPLTRTDGHRVPVVVVLVRRSTRTPGEGRHRALLSVLHAIEEPMYDVTLIEETFGLTQAEARLAAKIALGATPADCARELEVKISTIRSQLNAVYRKTGASGQTHLVRLILSLTIL